MVQRAWRELSPSRSPRAWAGLFLGVVVVAVMWREVFAGGMLLADDIWTSDLLNNNVPARVFVGRHIRSGHFPLWMPDSYGGLPVVPQGEAAATSPFTWVLYGLFDRVTATTISVGLHTWIAGFGMVLAAKRFGARTLSATAAGVSFMLCGFLIEHLKHMNMHHAAAFLPWMLYATDRLCASPGVRTALALSTLAGLQVVEGHPQMCYVSAFALGPVLACGVARHVPRRRRLAYASRVGGALAFAGMVALLLSGAYLLAGHELHAMSERASERLDRWEFCTRFGFEWENVITLVWAHAFGNGANATYDAAHGIFWESWLYAGVVPVFAAAVAILAGVWRVLRWRGRDALPVVGWALAAALSFALMLGKESPVYALAFRFVPGMSWFRFPQRFALVLAASVALLGAVGLDVLAKSAERRLGRWAGVSCGMLLLAATTADMLHFMTGHFHAIPRGVAMKPPATVTALRRRAPVEPWRMLPVFGSETHVEAFDVARGWQNWRPYVSQWAVLQPSTHLYWELESISGYTSMVPDPVGRMLGSLNAIGAIAWPRSHWAEPPAECAKRPIRASGPCRSRMRCLPSMARTYGAFNVRYLVSPLPLAECPGWALRDTVKTGALEIRIYENELVLPRAYVVGEVVDVPDSGAAAAKLTTGQVDPAQRATRLRGTGQKTAPFRAPAVGAPFPRPCRYDQRAPGSRRVRCDLDAPGYLVVADTLYPGTEVRVDGVRVEPFTAHGIQIGVPLEAGGHDVTIEFLPEYRFLVGAGALGWVSLAALAFARWIRRIATLVRAS